VGFKWGFPSLFKGTPRAVPDNDAQQVLLEANANLITELKRVKGELEDTLEKNEAYCH
jgi:hypothetical protein